MSYSSSIQRRDGIFYTEARGIRDIRDITGMPASNRQIIRNFKQNPCQNGRREPRGIGDVRDIPDYVWPNTQERQPE